MGVHNQSNRVEEANHLLHSLTLWGWCASRASLPPPEDRGAGLAMLVHWGFAFWCNYRKLWWATFWLTQKNLLHCIIDWNCHNVSCHNHHWGFTGTLAHWEAEPHSGPWLTEMREILLHSLCALNHKSYLISKYFIQPHLIDSHLANKTLSKQCWVTKHRCILMDKVQEMAIPVAPSWYLGNLGHTKPICQSLMCPGQTALSHSV